VTTNAAMLTERLAARVSAGCATGKAFCLDGIALVMLRARLEQTESELRAAQAQARQAEQRALLAEKSARDAWRFVKALRGARSMVDGWAPSSV